MKAAERYQIKIPIEFKSENLVKHKALLSNISLGGMCFNSLHYLIEGRNLKIQIPKKETVIETAGTVVWCRKNSRAYNVGVKFQQELDDSMLSVLMG